VPVTDADVVSLPGTAADGGGPAAGPPTGHREADGRRRRRRGVWALAGAFALAVVVVASWALWPAPPRPAPVTRPALPPVRPLISGAGGELVALLEAGQASTYHGRYQVIGDPAKIGGSQDLEIWNAPPRRRADTTRRGDGHTARSQTFTDATSTILCVQQDSDAWTCQRLAHQPADGTDPISTSVVAATSGQAVTVTNTTMSGRQVRCFAIATSDSLKVCATPGGIPVMIGNSAVSYQLVALDTKVSGATFTLPAKVGP
jgi:hypothetical protein